MGNSAKVKGKGNGKGNKFRCTEFGCTAAFDTARSLGRHKQAKHGIPGKGQTTVYRRANKTKQHKEATKSPILPTPPAPPTLAQAINALEVRIDAFQEVVELLKAMKGPQL